MKKTLLFSAIAPFVFMTGSKAQFNQYAQYYVAPVWLNPAQVGLVDDVEITTQYRESKMSGYQFPAISVAYPFFNKTSHLKRGGIGVGIA